MTCKRTQGFLAAANATVTTTVDAKKNPISARHAFDVLEGVDEIYATKGKKVVHLVLRGTRPTTEEIAALLIGPRGNLRAPTARQGRTLLVGFDEATYRRFIG